MRGHTPTRWTALRSNGWALPALILAAIALILWALAPKGTAIDYAVFHRAGARWLRGQSLYRFSEVPFPFKYAPIAAAFFAPLSLLPQRLAWLVMNGLSILALLRVMRWAAAQVFPRPPRWRDHALVLAVAAPWYGHLLWLGQSDGLVVWLLVESEALAKRRPFLSGSIWALACLVKPPFLVFLLPVIFLRQGRRLAGLAIGGAVWLLLGVLPFGLRGGGAELLAWRDMLASSTASMVCWEFNQSAFALVCTYLAPLGSPRFYPALFALATAIILAGVAAAHLLYRSDARIGRFAIGAFALYLGAFLSPLGWNTNLVAAIPLTWALVAVATSTTATASLRHSALAAALMVAFLNCADLLLLPFHFWPDTSKALLLLRQYGVAGALLTATSLSGQVLMRHTTADAPAMALE